MSKDYQWPSGVIRPARYQSGKNFRRPKKELEQFFSERFGAHAVVFPSARAALSAIVQAEGVKRGEDVFAPTFSSHCVWGVITPFASPTIQLHAGVRIAIVVHKFGYVERIGLDLPGVVVADSCDSLVTEASACLPDDAEYEVFSLPKIMGVFAGGLAITRDASKAERLLAMSNRQGDLNRFAGRLRFEQERGVKAPVHWEDLEYRNLSPTEGTLAEVKRNLSALEKNARKIEDRLAVLSKHFNASNSSIASVSPGRLPVQLLVKPELVKKGARDVLVRRVNRVGTSAKPDWQPWALIPLHFGVTDARFRRILGEFDV